MNNFDWNMCFGCQQVPYGITPYCHECKSAADSFWHSTINSLKHHDGSIRIEYGTEVIITANSRVNCQDLYDRLLKIANVDIGEDFKYTNGNREYIMKIKKDTNLCIKEQDNICTLSDRLVLRTSDRVVV